MHWNRHVTYWGRYMRLVARYQRHVNDGLWCRMTENACALAAQRWGVL